MKIIPKIIGELKEITLNEDDKGKVEIVIDKDKDEDVKTQVDNAVETLGDDNNITVSGQPNTSTTLYAWRERDNASTLNEYKTSTAQRYHTWVDVFTKGVKDNNWLRTVYLQKDIFDLAANVPFTDKDFDIIEEVYQDPDFLTQQALGGLGVILKNALARRSPLPEDMKIRLREFDTLLSTTAMDKGLNKKKKLERTMDPNLVNYHNKMSGIDSKAEAIGNMMGLPENQNFIGALLKKEINKILDGGSPDLGIKKEIVNSLAKQSDTKTKIKNRGDDTDPKDYIPVNLLILYAVLIKDSGLVHTAIEAEGQEVDPLEQKRVKGKFAPKLGTILAKLVDGEGMDEIKNILIAARIIPKPKKIKPKLEHKTMGRTIIISERQAQMLSLLRLSENAPKDKNLVIKNAAKKELIVDKSEEVAEDQRLNDYFVKEGIEYYKIVTKQDLLDEFKK